jgi:hypothetical protein
MGLLDLKTDLKSLKYGNDQRGGGSSNQPYIVTPIPDGYADIAADFLLRNGRLNPVNSLQDVSRLTKFFLDTKTPNGLLFTAKQELLERQNVVVPGGFNRIYNPLGTLAQAGVLSIGDHLNKQGLNPFARSYFKGGNEGYYRFTLSTERQINSSRLSTLYDIKQLGIPNGDAGLYNISNDSNYLFSYSGGPGSVLGVGNTNIRIIGNGYGNPFERTNNDINIVSAGNIYNNFGNIGGGSIAPPEPQLKQSKSTLLLALNQTYNPNIKTFNREDTYGISATNYTLRRGNPNDIRLNSKDVINVSPKLINNIPNSPIDTLKNQDLIKFFFEIIDNDDTVSTASTFLFFRAYINNLGDNFKADWNPYKYVGRAENFYKYGGFSRDMSLSFTIYAHSRAEMLPIYEKLNYLLGTTAPSYSGAGLMRGNFIRLTVGDYIDNVPGIINNISLKPSFDAGWDINRSELGTIITSEFTNTYIGQLPRMIEVDLGFTPIHNFVPQIGENFVRNIPPVTPLNVNNIASQTVRPLPNPTPILATSKTGLPTSNLITRATDFEDFNNFSLIE